MEKINMMSTYVTILWKRFAKTKRTLNKNKQLWKKTWHYQSTKILNHMLIKTFTNWNISKEKFKDTDNNNYRSIRYHSHFAARYGGVAQSISNLRYEIPNKAQWIKLWLCFIIKEAGKEF